MWIVLRWNYLKDIMENKQFNLLHDEDLPHTAEDYKTDVKYLLEEMSVITYHHLPSTGCLAALAPDSSPPWQPSSAGTSPGWLSRGRKPAKNVNS